MSTLIYYVNMLFFSSTLAQWYPTVFSSALCICYCSHVLGFGFLLLSVTVHMFLWIYWSTRMYKCLLASESVKFKFSQLHTHMHSCVRRYSIYTPVTEVSRISWPTAHCGFTAERDWCNRSVTASPALWVLLWGLEPLVDLQRGSCPPGASRTLVNHPGDLESSSAFVSRVDEIKWNSL